VKKGKKNIPSCIEKLEFSQVRNYPVAVPKTFEYNSIQDLEGLQFLFLSKCTVLDYFKSKKYLTVRFYQISGSVEIAQTLVVYSDTIVDIVSMSTLFKK
jgi:ATP phosphoribosyltransferase